MKLKQSIFIVLTLSTAVLNMAGQQTALMHWSGVMSQRINPAFEVENEWELGFYNRSFAAGSSAFSIDDLVVDSPGGKKVVSPRSILGSLSPENSLIFDHNFGTVDIAYKLTNKIQVSAGHSFRASGAISYSADLVQLIAEGNEPLAGKTLSIGMDVDYQSYHQLYLGIGYKLGKVQIASRIKLLGGLQTAQASDNALFFSTAKDLSTVTLMGNYNVSLSGIDVDDSANTTLLWNGHQLSNFGFQNKGTAVDFGLSYKGDKASIFVSAADIGGITWTQSSKQYGLNGERVYAGFTVDDVLYNDNGLDILDSIENQIDISKDSATFETSLPMTINGGMTYKWSDKIESGLSIKHTSYQAFTQTQIVASGVYNASKYLAIGPLLSYQTDLPFNIGLHGRLSYGAFSLYGILSNAKAAIFPTKIQQAYANIGLVIKL